MILGGGCGHIRIAVRTTRRGPETSPWRTIYVCGPPGYISAQSGLSLANLLASFVLYGVDEIAVGNFDTARLL
jgi:hypothetical protein